MESAAFQDPALTVALALAAGMLAQAVARHLKVPGIVLLLGTAQRSLKDFKVPRVWVAVRRTHLGVDTEVVRRLGGRLLFGRPEEIVAWTDRLERGEAAVEGWLRSGEPSTNGVGLPDLDGRVLPLAVQRGKKCFPVDESVTFKRGDRLLAAVVREGRQDVAGRLQEAGWEPVAPA